METLEALEQAGTLAAPFVRSVSNDQLRKTGHYAKLVSDFGAPPTVERLVNVLIDHPGWHLDDIKAVCHQ